MSNPSPGSKQRTFLGHPIGLYVLFFTEMWERFSYYGMRALLMTYMLNYLKWSQFDASKTYKAYTSFVYVTPILGGYLADRYLGNKRAVIIGAILMAIGHFLMAFEAYEVFMAALVFLILGNGFFKPNMSTQVGRLYPPGDGRRDGAYTIFYMGINLGAFMSPLVCGWLQENTVGGHHSGFTMAGIGMVIGLMIYLLGQPLIREIAVVENVDQKSTILDKAAPGAALSEAQAAAQPTRLGPLYTAAPPMLFLLGSVLLCGVVGMEIAARIFEAEMLDPAGRVLLGIGGGCLILMGYVCGEVQGGVRDRVLAILALGVFVIFFWAAFEQAGNVFNQWADKNTNRFLTIDAPPASPIPEVIEDAPRADGDAEPARADGLLTRFVTMFRLKPRAESDKEASATWGDSLKQSFNPMPTAWFQSINALGIFVIAPFFAWMWVALDRRGWQPSIPLKMVLGLMLMSASMAMMTAAATQENKPTKLEFAGSLPPGIAVDAEHRVGHQADEKAKLVPYQAGRLTFDDGEKSLLVYGVLSDNERDNIIEVTAPAEFRETVKKLVKQSGDIDDNTRSVSIVVDPVPPGFDMKFSGLKQSVVRWQPAEKTLVAYQPLKLKEEKGLLAAAGEPQFRQAIGQLFVDSQASGVSSWWLFWTYIMATLGELCLSPVGLSMVSKLAPAKFATMLMGVWLLTSAFGHFAAGALGELWGTIPPVQFFLLSTVVVGAAAAVLLLLVRIMVSAMHGVK